MNKMKYLIITIMFFIFGSISVDAASVSISGSSSVNVGDEVSYRVVVSSSEAVAGIQGVVKYDTGAFSYISSSPMMSPLYVMENNVGSGTYNIAGADMSGSGGFSSASTVYTIRLKALRSGSGKVSVSDFYVTNQSSVLSGCGGATKTVTIQEKAASETPSTPASSSDTNSNQSSTSSSSTTKKSNSKTTSSSSDSRSSNNNLASLRINDVELTPVFSASTTNYKISVANTVEKIDVNAVAEDSKSKVSINNNDNLTENGITNVTIVVTAENGDKKTYTIEVTRGTLPDKVLSNDNYLIKLVPSVGILSPVFDKEITTYFVYLPYEIETIDFETSLSDGKTANLNVEKPDKLEVGNNVYKYNVTAEDESIRTYTINIIRAINPMYANSSNTKLKDLSVTDGILLFLNGQKVNDFDGNVFKYYYKGNNPTFNAIPEDDNAKVTMIQNGKDYEIIVESPSGDYAVYILSPYKNMLILYVILIILGFGCGYTTYYYIKNKNNKLSKFILNIYKKSKKNKTK